VTYKHTTEAMPPVANSLGELVAAHKRFTNAFRANPIPMPVRDPLTVVREVKHLYMTHQHEECSSRAIQLVGELAGQDVSSYRHFILKLESCL
jgi:hypothetical protein